MPRVIFAVSNTSLRDYFSLLILQLLNVADDNSRKEEFNEVSWSFGHPPQVRTLDAYDNL